MSDTTPLTVVTYDGVTEGWAQGSAWAPEGAENLGPSRSLNQRAMVARYLETVFSSNLLGWFAARQAGEVPGKPALTPAQFPYWELHLVEDAARDMRARVAPLPTTEAQDRTIVQVRDAIKAVQRERRAGRPGPDDSVHFNPAYVAVLRGADGDELAMALKVLRDYEAKAVIEGPHAQGDFQRVHDLLDSYGLWPRRPANPDRPGRAQDPGLPPEPPDAPADSAVTGVPTGDEEPF